MSKTIPATPDQSENSDRRLSTHIPLARKHTDLGNQVTSEEMR
jgi:hypothetical protein